MRRCRVQRVEYEQALGAMVLDVRMDFEYAHGHIRGAVNIPASQVMDRLDEVPREHPVLVVCNHGNRSSVVADRLEGLGYVACLVDGGLSAWQESGRRLVKGFEPG